MIKTKVQRLLQSKGVRSIAVLAGGTALAQIITIASLPVLTRIYTPEDFAVLAVFTSLAGILSVIGCARLEMAIPIPEADQDSAALLITALAVSAVFSTLLFALLCFNYEWVAAYGGEAALDKYVLLVPVAIWFTSSSLALQYWLARMRRFNIVSQAKISRSASGSAIQIGTGWFGMGVVGLLLGQIVIGGAGGLRQVFNIAAKDSVTLKSVTLERMKNMVKEFKGFSLYSSLGAISNSSSSHIPVLLIAAFAIGPEAGFLILATRVMSSPISLIGSAVSQVYVSRAPEAWRLERLDHLTVRTLQGLIKTAVGPLVILGVVAPVVFAYLFGQDWQRAGEIVTMMTPWIVMQFLATPVATVLQITRRERVAFALQLFGLILRVSMVLVAAFWWPERIVEAFVLSGFVFYSVYLAVIIKICGIGAGALLHLGKLLLVVILAALLIAFALDYLLGYVLP